MSNGLEELKKTFRAEAMELLAALESSLLELECSPGNQETIGSIFRVFHTLKGTGAMCGFDEISHFTHEIETLYDMVRCGKITPDKELIDVTLAAGDLIKQFLTLDESSTGELAEQEAGLLAAFRKFMPQEASAAPSGKTSGAVAPGAPPVQAKQVTYRVRFKPFKEIFRGGTNPVLLLSELRGLGDCTIAAHTDAIPDIYEMDAEACYTFWDAILTTDKGLDAIRDIFIFVENESELKIDIIDNGESSLGVLDYKRLGEILVEKRELRREDLEAVLQTRKLLGEMLIEKGLVDPQTVEMALTEQERLKQIRENRLKIESMANIRVSSQKLDKLVNLVGELVTVQARLSQTCAARNDAILLSISEEVERLTMELRDNTMDIRMMPIGSTFSSLKRVVRDLSIELGKQVELITDGGETELDKTVIEKLHDPLVHLIRNSLDHGVELPAAREKAGKSAGGIIHLAAAHSGDHVVIQIMDDGKGLDPRKIREKAVKSGLIQQDEQLSEREIYELILAPGFTTAEGVTSVSGRGVGMDVVKKAVDALRGSIHIESHLGYGTTITLVLPLTLAIIEGLLVRIGGDHFVLPLSLVEECMELTGKDISRHHGRHIADVRGKVVPYIRLREHFMTEGARPEIEQIVIVNSDNHRIGLVVDSVIGGHQTVIKTLGKVFRDIRGVSGASILGDGSVCLIVDVEKLIHSIEKEEVAG
ncbi:MAG: chemotaxis protein CheA [Nitrospirae bacterium]|nr:MAG: chemotaxis protein CheA [Nitrospirota bacterium]